MQVCDQYEPGPWREEAGRRYMSSHLGPIFQGSHELGANRRTTAARVTLGRPAAPSPDLIASVKSVRERREETDTVGARAHKNLLDQIQGKRQRPNASSPYSDAEGDHATVVERYGCTSHLLHRRFEEDLRVHVCVCVFVSICVRARE